jgi:hypothetical protein
MIFILVAAGPGRGNFSGISRIEERDRATSADLSAQGNFEDGLLSKAYVDCVKTVRRKSVGSGSSGIVNKGYTPQES